MGGGGGVDQGPVWNIKIHFSSLEASLFVLTRRNPFTAMQNKCLFVEGLDDGLYHKQYEPRSDCSKSNLILGFILFRFHSRVPTEIQKHNSMIFP